MRLRAVAAALLALPACGAAGAGEPAGPVEVVLDAHWSRFSTSSVSVPRGVPVRFVVRNDDPIDHELATSASSSGTSAAPSPHTATGPAR